MSFFSALSDMLKNVDWGGVAKTVAPIAANLYNDYNRSQEAEKLAKAQEKSYAGYLNAINPPPEVLDQRYLAANEATNKSMLNNFRMLDNRLAARGQRGRGVVSDIAQLGQQGTELQNQNYHNAYSQYNVPGMPPPVNYAPSFGATAGQTGAQIANYMAPRWWLNPLPDQQGGNTGGTATG